jgi:hypothetical protein
MTWHFRSALHAFDQHRKHWDALNVERGGHVLLDSLFVDCLLCHFADDDVLVGIEDSVLGGMAILKKKAAGMWETFQPSQAPLGLVTLNQSGRPEDALASLLRSLPGYALQVSIMHQDPDYFLFSAGNGQSHFEKLDYIRTARILLQGTFDEYWQSREGRLRKNNDRLRRRMAEKGLRLDFVTIRESSNVADAIREYGLLESKGWKAREGTAVTAENVQGRFYRDLLERFCAQGDGAIYQLRIDGRVVASDICLTRNGTMVLLKTAYDEEWSVYSPAFLMREDVMRQLYAERRINTYEFYGPLMDYQLRWTDQVRTLYHLTCFRHPVLRPLKNFVKRVRRSG